MPNTTETILALAAYTLHRRGLHCGNQFAAPGSHGSLDVCAAIFIAAEHGPAGPYVLAKDWLTPPEFYTDEDASLRLIECSAPAMQAIRALSNALDTEPPTTRISDDHEVSDYIEHVSNWAATAPIGYDFPPTTSEVIGRILRTANAIHATALAA